MRDSPENHSFRDVYESDENLLHLWSNDPETRKNSFNSNFIKEKNIISGLKKLNDPNVIMWLYLCNQIPVGLVRFEKNENYLILNYQICPKSRQQGYAAKMLKLSIQKIKKFWGKKHIYAYVKHKNIPSIKTLEKSNFLLENKSFNSLKYIYIFNKNCVE